MRTYSSYSVGMDSLTGAVASSPPHRGRDSGNPAAGGTTPPAVLTMQPGAQPV
jgi:hypothetical protein